MIDHDIALIISGGIAALSSVMAATLGGVAVVRAGQASVAARQTHDLVNSRMTELLELTRRAALAEGFKAGQPECGEPQDTSATLVEKGGSR